MTDLQTGVLVLSDNLGRVDIGPGGIYILLGKTHLLRSVGNGFRIIGG